MFPLSSPFAYASKREYNFVSTERLMKFGNVVRVGTTIFDKDRGAVEEGRSQTGVRYDCYIQLVAIRPN